MTTERHRPALRASDGFLAESAALGERARLSLAGGVSTAFRMYERPTPLFLREARGAELVDVDGNRYIDFVCGFGPIILGHSHPGVGAAVASAAMLTQQTGGQHEAEVDLAEVLCKLVPAFETVRLSLTGSEAIHAAVRLARAATGRAKVLKFAGHYHGWLDGIFTATSSPRPGPDSDGQLSSGLAEVMVIEWNDPEQLAATFDSSGEDIAAVIMEPLPCNQGVIYPQPGYLELARRLCSEAGAVLIFDEVITGFRLGLGGAHELFGVTPDLAVVAKALGNGFPISAFGGRHALMERVATNAVVHAGTYNGGGISVAAAQATLEELARDDLRIHSQLRELGKRMANGLTELGTAHGHRIVTQGPGPVFYSWFLDEGGVERYSDHLRADPHKQARFAELLLHEGVRVIPAGRWYLSAAHTESHIDRALDAADAALSRM